MHEEDIGGFFAEENFHGHIRTRGVQHVETFMWSSLKLADNTVFSMYIFVNVVEVRLFIADGHQFILRQGDEASIRGVPIDKGNVLHSGFVNEVLGHIFAHFPVAIVDDRKVAEALGLQAEND